MEKMKSMCKKLLWLSLMIISLSLSACIMYKPPENGPTAYLAAPGGWGPYSTQVFSVFNDPYRCTLIKAPTAMIKELNGIPFKIAANQLFTVMIMHINKTNRFVFVLSFMPKPNYHYFVSVKDEYENDDKGSYIMAKLVLLEDDGLGDGYHPVPFLKRAYGASDTYCLDTEVQDRLKNGQYQLLPKTISWQQQQLIGFI